MTGLGAELITFSKTKLWFNYSSKNQKTAGPTQLTLGAGSSCDNLNRGGKGMSSGTPVGALGWDAADYDRGESLCWEQTPRERALPRSLPAALLESSEQDRF